MGQKYTNPPHHDEPALVARRDVVKDAALPALRFLLWCLSLALLAWALLDPQFRDAEGFLHGTVCLPISASVALLVLGWAVVGPLRKAASWLTLALVGQAVALQTIEETLAVYRGLAASRSSMMS